MIINSIDTEDISFVVQGAVDKRCTKLCLESIRRNFPGCTIILSTWENSNIRGLNFDKVIFNRDPGSAVYDTNGTCNNINRQLLSSYVGLKAVTTQYAAKVRSDLIFDGPDFLTYFNKFSSYNEQYKLVKSRIIVLSMYSRQFCDIRSGVKLQNYHPSDWFSFGYAEDVLNYFSAPFLSDVSLFSRYFLEYDDKNKLLYSMAFFQNTPEQYFGANFRGRDVKKETILTLSSSEDQFDSLQFMVNNFIILDYNYSKIYSGKWEVISKDEFSCPATAVGLFFYGDFLRYYKRYCDQNYVIPGDIDKKILKKKLRAAKDFLWRDKIREHWHNFAGKIKARLSFLKKMFRWILPAYRVGYGTRDILLHMQEEQRSNLGYLHYKIDKLSQEVHEKSKEIEELNKHMAALMTQDNDKSS